MLGLRAGEKYKDVLQKSSIQCSRQMFKYRKIIIIPTRGDPYDGMCEMSKDGRNFVSARRSVLSVAEPRLLEFLGPELVDRAVHPLGLRQHRSLELQGLPEDVQVKNTFCIFFLFLMPN
jgi:hypothetical protein